MLFIRRTIIRKHNWAEGRMEWRWGVVVKGQSRELRILLVESHGHPRIDSLSMCAAESVSRTVHAAPNDVQS